MRDFVYQILPTRVVFGPGRRRDLPSELAALDVERCIIIADPSHRKLSEEIANSLADRCITIHDQVVQHVPKEAAETARKLVIDRDADACVTVGGGSATGLGKAVALEVDVLLAAIPTTYAGSEMTPIWGLTEAGRKQTGRDPRVLPQLVIYDPELLTTLPREVIGPSGMNAIAHCVEALYAKDGNPVTSLLSQEGTRALAAALPKAVADPGDLEAQSEALYGSWLAGIALGSVGMALHHKLCHVLGGSFSMPHAETHAVILPHATAFNLKAAPEMHERLTEALGTPKIASALWELGRSVGAPTSLQSLGFRQADIDSAARLAAEQPYYNPREVKYEAVRQLLRDAYEGVRPIP